MAGALDTEPVPSPSNITFNSCNITIIGSSLKVAVTVVSALKVNVQDLVPLQPPPLQPAKVEPPFGVAINLTVVPLS